MHGGRTKRKGGGGRDEKEALPLRRDGGSGTAASRRRTEGSRNDLRTRVGGGGGERVARAENCEAIAINCARVPSLSLAPSIGDVLLLSRLSWPSRRVYTRLYFRYVNVREQFVRASLVLRSSHERVRSEVRELGGENNCAPRGGEGRREGVGLPRKLVNSILKIAEIRPLRSGRQVSSL